ncbi:putative leucine-rich repeat receptor-like protein kinase [Ananas comosus]|uniref:Putative leucine-rich repeat receptor-like protein kinase n=1 Tax=Ananas comosus TaxID=4615 RepID=A0A199V7S9_ANACO|nr:putative leucine-rich repeat receptor-like protein kinase [Ananas comosus]
MKSNRYRVLLVDSIEEEPYVCRFFARCQDLGRSPPERSPAIEVDELRNTSLGLRIIASPLGHIFDHRPRHTFLQHLPVHLKKLNKVLNSNKFIGKTPATLGKLSNLSWLDLADNQLNGTLLMSMMVSGLDRILNAQHL